MARGRTQKRKRTMRRRQKGGSSIASNELAFYTGYYGPDIPWKGSMIPQAPSTTYDCYYITNNPVLFEKLKGTQWNPIFDTTPIKSDYQGNALDAKTMKVAPNRFKELTPYTYLCYFDSKLHVDAGSILPLVERLKGSDALFVLGKHPKLKTVSEEFVEAMKHERYAQERAKLESCMKKYASGAPEPDYKHHCTGFIVRKQGPETTKINEEWYSLVQECGTECQISFSFIYSKYKRKILTSNACAKLTSKNIQEPFTIE